MRAYIDHVLALLPFEPEAHRRLGGPACTYVGHPLIEKLDDIRDAPTREFAERIGIKPNLPVLLVLPGSRRSEVERLTGIFGETVALLEDAGRPVQVVIPAVRRLRDEIARKVADWKEQPIIVDGPDDKYSAMRAATAALAASGTVTLELALAGCPAVVAYRTDNISAKFIFLIKVSSVVLANLVLGKNVYPEFLQDRCRASLLAEALLPLLSDTDQRLRQLEELAKTPDMLKLEASSPSLAAAEAVIKFLDDQADGKSRRGRPT
jgi:lipid-A-disaccharide synthase